MSCCKGIATWFCCYPDACGCDGCCCAGSNCSGGCSSSSKCGQGACCTCNSGSLGYAWDNGGSRSCGISINCGSKAWNLTNDCVSYAGGVPKVDSGPAPSTGHMIDFTKALFTTYAPLSQGTIPNMRIVNNLGCC
jgi:hypothetical protein